MCWKAITTEQQAYIRENVYEEYKPLDVPCDNNVISSCHLFFGNTYGQKDSLRLKCLLVPHGHHAKEKDEIRSHVMTVQFSIITPILSIRSLLLFSISSIKIKIAYLQTKTFGLDIYMKPPTGWASLRTKRWKLNKILYGLVDSGHFWQLTIDRWLVKNSFTEIPGLQ